MPRHIAGTFSQSNKAPKRRHDSKRHAKRTTKGKIERGSAKQMGKSKSGKAARLNLAKQLREQKKQEKLDASRVVGGRKGAPKIVGIIKLDDNVDLPAVMKEIEADREVSVSESSATTVTLPGFNTRLSVIISESRHILDILDVVKVADILVCCISAPSNDGMGDVKMSKSKSKPKSGSHIDALAQRCISAIYAQGMPTVVGLIQGLDKILHQGWRVELRRNITHDLESAFGNDIKVISDQASSTSTSTSPLIRTLGQLTPKRITWRDMRPYVVAEEIEVSQLKPGTEEAKNKSKSKVDRCDMSISGYLRGSAISASDLVHIMNLGTYSVSVIYEGEDPAPITKKKEKEKEMDDGGSGSGSGLKVLDTSDETKQDPLGQYHEHDHLSGEQTWPTAEEMQMAREAEKARIRGLTGEKKARKVPKGTSDYQAAWYPSDEDEEEMEDFGEMGDSDDDDDSDEEEEEKEDVGTTSKEDEDNAWMEDLNALQKRRDARDEKQKEEDEEGVFPDEVDVPIDVPARTRFARYRGLQNFRNADWDVNEMLPVSYSRIFRLSNFSATQKDAVAEIEDKLVKPGIFIRIIVEDVPLFLIKSEIGLGAGGKAAQTAFGKPIILSGLLRNENRMTVLHFNLSRTPLSKEPIRSKDPVIFHCGFMTPYVAHPIYSDDVRSGSGGPQSSKTIAKFEKYLLPSRSSIASIFAPVTYGTQPLLVFKPADGILSTIEKPVDDIVGSATTSSGLHYPCSAKDLSGYTMIANGALASVNPDRVILKRIILTGIPYKTHRNKVTARFMFFNPEDVKWFKPVRLSTKYGRHGHIMMPLGTHGRMKCVFDGVVQQHDTVMMSLYKRQFPKWDGPMLEDELEIDFDVELEIQIEINSNHSTPQD